MQLSIVARHLRWAWPETRLLIESEEGTQAAFAGLCEAEPVSWPWQHRGFERGYYLHWEHPNGCYAGVPSTKVSRCLTWIFNLPLAPELYHYNLQITDQDRQKVDTWLSTLPLQHFHGYVLLHYKGTSRPERKNLSEYEASLAAASLLGLGYLVILLDWSPPQRPDPLINGKTVIGADALWGKTQRGQPCADVGTLGALIEKAQYVVGIDSGPEHVAAATGTPTFIVWRENHPIHCFDLAPNVYHFVPPDHQERIMHPRYLGVQCFESMYRHEVAEMEPEFFSSLGWYCERGLDELLK